MQRVRSGFISGRCGEIMPMNMYFLGYVHPQCIMIMYTLCIKLIHNHVFAMFYSRSLYTVDLVLVKLYTMAACSYASH